MGSNSYKSDFKVGGKNKIYILLKNRSAYLQLANKECDPPQALKDVEIRRRVIRLQAIRRRATVVPRGHPHRRIKRVVRFTRLWQGQRPPVLIRHIFVFSTFLKNCIVFSAKRQSRLKWSVGSDLWRNYEATDGEWRRLLWGWKSWNDMQLLTKILWIKWCVHFGNYSDYYYFLYLPFSGIAPCVGTADAVHDKWQLVWTLSYAYPLSHHGWIYLGNLLITDLFSFRKAFYGVNVGSKSG